MNRSVTIAAALVAAVAMLACEGEDEGRVEDNRPPQDRVVDPAKARRYGIEVNGTGPYHIFVHVQNEDGTGGSAQTREDVAAGRYTQTGDYTSGAKVRIRVSVTGHADDLFDCKIIDGLPKPDKKELPSGPAAVWAGPDHGKTYCGYVTAG